MTINRIFNLINNRKDKRELSGLDRILDVYGKKRKHYPTILILGDSVLERISKNDNDTRSLSQMITEGKENQILAVSGTACNPKLYYYIVRLLSKTVAKPKNIIFCINSRSFSPQWDLNPEWQHQNLICQLKRNFRREFRFSRKALSIKKSEELFNNKICRFYHSPFSRIGYFQLIKAAHAEGATQEKLRYKALFIYHYNYILDDSNQQLRYYCKLLDILMKSGINTVSYITPVNYEAGLRFVGKQFLIPFRQNIRKIEKYHKKLARKNSFHDYSLLLGSEYFFHNNIPIEHLNSSGRKILSEVISNKIIRLMNKT
ncbi:hypothetical protein A2Y99_01260 [Candidatus Gottesmanbacteria bacterium RBG_13_37_7]|uniref:SGNH/GDSL hydrolase family protein n=1 Tax=Candidatus Gottesmanbacteria bacterium RBG_13_37_7 TaxID=1798369 RepID=A0A1F5YHX8_9BACT|nr:MAG: hypothetical protein A2Y99_01260 [Candidatus Gottesmanbacteria bacterium RBG_13_37_7]